MAKQPRPCGNEECCCSTGICDSLTYGRGELDSYGYWEIPCLICARAAEARDGERVGTYWPFDSKSAWVGNTNPAFC
jgi:hypothetical protein